MVASATQVEPHANAEPMTTILVVLTEKITLFLFISMLMTISFTVREATLDKDAQVSLYGLFSFFN